jgi:hypothetical protein
MLAYVIRLELRINQDHLMMAYTGRNMLWLYLCSSNISTSRHLHGWRTSFFIMGSLCTSVTIWPNVPAPDDDDGDEDCGQPVECWQEKPKYSVKTCPSTTSFTTNLTWPEPVLKPGPLRWEAGHYPPELRHCLSGAYRMSWPGPKFCAAIGSFVGILSGSFRNYADMCLEGMRKILGFAVSQKSLRIG